MNRLRQLTLWSLQRRGKADLIQGEKVITFNRSTGRAERQNSLPLHFHVGKGSRFDEKAKVVYGIPSRQRKQPSQAVIDFYSQRQNGSQRDELYQENAIQIDHIVTTLLSITPPHFATDANFVFHVPSYNLDDVPRFDVPLSFDSFDAYIRELTQCEYVYKHSSGRNQIVDKILRQIFHSENSIAARLRSLKSYNYMLRYYIRKNDITSARHYLKQMHTLDDIHPDATTINLFLNQLVSVKSHTVDPLATASYYLGLMRARNIQADLTTWLIIYELVPMSAKDALLMKLQTHAEHPRFSYLILKDYFEDKRVLGEKRESKSKSMLKVLNSFKKINSDSVNLVVTQLLNEGTENLRQVIPLINMLLKERLKPSVSLLNNILRVLSDLKRIDLSMGVFNTLTQKLHIRPNLHSYHLLIKASVKMGYHENWRRVLRIIYHKMVECNDSKISISSYWLTRAHARAITDRKQHCHPLHLDPPLTKAEKTLQRRMDELLIWEMNEVKATYIRTRRSYFKICRDIGCPTGAPQTALKFVETTDGDRLKRETFKRALKLKNINNQYQKRGELLEIGLRDSLVKELKERKIIEEVL